MVALAISHAITGHTRTSKSTNYCPSYYSCTWKHVINYYTNQIHINFIIGLLDNVDENPSCLQTICASVESQELSHTVPHTPLTQISTRPSLEEEPLTSLTVPLVQSEYNIMT